MIRAIVCLIIGVSLIAAPAFADTRMPNGSFLTRCPTTVRDLVSQVRSNPAVASRYCANFHVTKDELVRYFSSDLKLTTLKRPMTATVWYLGKNGKMYSATRTLKAGDRVFTAGDGTPVLCQNCGNPMTTRLPAIKAAKAKPALKMKSAGAGAALAGSSGIAPATLVANNATDNGAPVTAPEAVAAATPPATESKVLGTSQVSAAPAAVTDPPVVVADAQLVAAQPDVEMAALPEDMAVMSQPAIEAAPAAASGGGMSFGAIGALAGLAGGLAAALGGGHHSPAPTPKPVPTPEPASLLVLASALTAAAVSFRPRRR